MLSLRSALRFGRLLSGAGLLSALFFFWTTAPRVPPLPRSFYVHPSNFFEAETFGPATEEAFRSTKKYPAPFYGGVVPHHLVPSFVIADFFKNLAKQRPETLILVGPNHYERGKYSVLSSAASWKTPFGYVEADRDALSALSINSVVSLNDEVLSLEHSMGNIMPFVKYYLPDTKVIPIILSKDLKEPELELLLKQLRPFLDRGAPLVVSVDFSHYQTRADAEQNDVYTESLILEGAIGKLLSLGSEYVDSPPSIALSLLYMRDLGKNAEFLYHTNSGIILKREDREITSYFSWAF